MSVHVHVGVRVVCMCVQPFYRCCCYPVDAADDEDDDENVHGDANVDDDDANAYDDAGSDEDDDDDDGLMGSNGPNHYNKFYGAKPQNLVEPQGLLGMQEPFHQIS